MKLTANLAKSQLKTNRRRSFWTLLGIVVAVAMITTVYGLVASGFGIIDAHMADSGSRELYYATLTGIGVVLSSIVVLASVIVVSNAFRVSAGERRAQFGMLKSVGATKQQIAETVLYEGVFLSAIGIPIGIFVGLVMQFVGVHVINFLLSDINLGMEARYRLTADFVVAWQAVLAAIVMAFATVLLSAWLPARKASRIPAIEAIRGAGEVKLRAKQLRTSKLVQTLFGVEGALAAKSLKRSRRNMRATVVSLSVSIVLFIAVGAFGQQMARMAEMFWPGIDATAIAMFHTHWTDHFDDDGALISSSFNAIHSDAADAFTERFRAYTNASVLGVGTDNFSYNTTMPAADITPQAMEIMRYIWESAWEESEWDTPSLGVVLISVDPQTHAELANRAGVPPGSNILMNHARFRFDDGRRIEYTPYVFSGQTLQLTGRFEGEREIALHGQLTAGQVPNELMDTAGIGRIGVIVSEQVALTSYHWFVNTQEPDAFADYAHEAMAGFTELGNVHVNNIQREMEIQRDLTRLVLTLVYGFVALLTLIGLTNVISTISANVRARAGEFAVLQSVGMTYGGVKRMLRLESLLSSAKSLVIGVPLGIAAALGLHHAISETAGFAFSLPWMPMLLCALGVFAITWVAMWYCAAQLRGRSIIDAIRMG